MTILFKYRLNYDYHLSINFNMTILSHDPKMVTTPIGVIKRRFKLILNTFMPLSISLGVGAYSITLVRTSCLVPYKKKISHTMAPG